MRSSIVDSVLLLMGLICILSACTEPEEGCLDINAANFQIDADRACAGCCEYPSLQLNFQHKLFPDTSLNLVYEDSVYQDGAGNNFRIQRIQYYLSDLRLIRPDGSELSVVDTLQFTLEQPDGQIETVVIEDNFALVDPGDFRRRTIGTIRGEGMFNSIKFTLGIAGVANTINPESFPDDHPLAAPDLYQGPDTGRIFNLIELFRIESGMDTVRTVLDISMSQNLRMVELELPSPFVLDPGFSVSLVLRVNYLEWFKDVDLLAESEAQIIQKIVQNLTDAFSVVEIEAQSG